jgi:hypothetical protein
MAMQLFKMSYTNALNHIRDSWTSATGLASMHFRITLDLRYNDYRRCTLKGQADYKLRRNGAS